MLGQARLPEGATNEDEFSFSSSVEDREMMRDFITMVADFLTNRFPTQKNTSTNMRQKVQAAEGIPNNDSTTTTTS